MRIIGGSGRGRRLRAPSGDDTRPTGDRVKQTLFDILAPRIPGCHFLDVCAGAGGIGLEALSRGAARVVFVDNNRAAVSAVRENLAALAGSGEAQVFQQDAGVALAALADSGVTFDVVYLDPPYESAPYEDLLHEISRGRLLEPQGLIVAEHFHKRVLPETIEGLSRTRSVRIGDHRLTFYSVSGDT